MTLLNKLPISGTLHQGCSASERRRWSGNPRPSLSWRRSCDRDQERHSKAVVAGPPSPSSDGFWVEPSLGGLAIIVVTIVAATCCRPPSSPSMIASPAHRLIIRPGFITHPRATKGRPRAGARTFTLYSSVSTSSLAGSKLRAAYPQALSTAALTTAPCR
jgi:hypothetical protein